MQFSREITNTLNVALDIYNIILCIFMTYSLLTSSHKIKRNKAFAWICVTILIFNLADMSNWLFEGTTPAWHVPALHILTFVFYAVTPFCFLSIIHYVKHYIEPHKLHRGFYISSNILTILYLAGTFVSHFMDFFYTFTPDNYYARGKYNYICNILYFGFFVLVSGVLSANKKHFTKKEFWTFMTFPFLPLIMVILQVKLYGLALVNIGMTLSILLLFLNLHTNLEQSYAQKEQEVESSEKKLINFQEHTIISLSNLVENRDTDTGEHARRTSLFVELLARKTMRDGYYTDIINDSYIKLLVRAAPMHDIGKIVVSDSILKKHGKLDDFEYEMMKQHAEEGGRIVSDIIGITEDEAYIQIAKEMAQSHHERWDGEGYPNKLANEQIPLAARLMAIADVFDALVFDRCYKKAVSPEEAFEIIKDESGTHFDPILVSEFLLLKEEITRIVHIYRD